MKKADRILTEQNIFSTFLDMSKRLGLMTEAYDLNTLQKYDMSLRDKDPNVIAHVLMNPPKVVGYSVGSHDANNGEALKYLEVLQSMIQDEDLAKGIEQLKAVGDEGFGGVYATLLKHLRNKYSQNYLNLLKH